MCNYSSPVVIEQPLSASEIGLCYACLGSTHAGGDLRERSFGSALLRASASCCDSEQVVPAIERHSDPRPMPDIQRDRPSIGTH